MADYDVTEYQMWSLGIKNLKTREELGGYVREMSTTIRMAIKGALGENHRELVLVYANNWLREIEDKAKQMGLDSDLDGLFAGLELVLTQGFASLSK